MIVTSRNANIQLFSQSLLKTKFKDSPNATQHKNALPSQERDMPAGERFISDNNVKTSVNQARLLDDQQNAAPVTREVPIDESYRDTINPIGFLGFGNGRRVVGAMSKDSTVERPEVYLELWEKDQKKAYLIDINNIDPAKMTRIEALALAKHMPFREDYRASTLTYDNPSDGGETIVSGDFGDTPGWWVVISMVSGSYDKDPAKDPDWCGPESFDEKINYFDTIQSYLSTAGFSQDVMGAVDRYLDRLEKDEEMTASDKMKGTLDLLQGLGEAYDRVDAMIQKKGVEKVAGVLGESVETVYSWLAASGRVVTPESEKTEESDSQGLVELFQATKATRFGNMNRADEFDWWHDILNNESNKK